MKSCRRRASSISAEAGSVIGDAAVRAKAVGGGHAEAVVGVVVACSCGGGESVVSQTGTLPGASW